MSPMAGERDASPRAVFVQRRGPHRARATGVLVERGALHGRRLDRCRGRALRFARSATPLSFGSRPRIRSGVRLEEGRRPRRQMRAHPGIRVDPALHAGGHVPSPEHDPLVARRMGCGRRPVGRSHCPRPGARAPRRETAGAVMRTSVLFWSTGVDRPGRWRSRPAAAGGLASVSTRPGDAGAHGDGRQGYDRGRQPPRRHPVT